MTHYSDLSKKGFFPELIRYMASGPVVPMVWEGLNAVKQGRMMLGATNPKDSDPGTIRGDLCIDVGRNVIHGSDSLESAAKEIALWFKPEEISQWRSAQVEWCYEEEELATAPKPVASHQVLNTKTKEEFYHPSLNFPHGPVATPTKHKSRRIKNGGEKVLCLVEFVFKKFDIKGR